MDAPGQSNHAPLPPLFRATSLAGTAAMMTLTGLCVAQGDGRAGG